jgi:uncharacterized protein (TIGR02598 family)
VKRFLASTSAFSLVELTLALGIAAFCLIAVLGLMPIGVQTNRNATSQTAATNIIAAVISDLQATPKTATASTQFGISFVACPQTTTPKSTRLYFDSEGQLVGRCDCCIDAQDTSPGMNARYRLSVTYPTNPAGLAYFDLIVTWPAGATPVNASGSTEMFAAFDRN